MLAQRLIAPYSDRRYAAERVGREPLLEPAKAIVSQICGLNLNVEGRTFATRDRDLTRALQAQKEAKDKLDQLIPRLLEETNFTDVTVFSTSLKKITEQLEICSSRAQAVMRNISSHFPLPAGGKQHLQDLRRDVDIYKVMLDLFICIDLGMQINTDPDYKPAHDVINKVAKAAESLNSILKQELPNIPEDIRKVLQPNLDRFFDLFKEIGIKKFFEKGRLLERFEGTVFDLPDEMTEQYLTLIMELSDELKKDQVAIECFKGILSRNSTLSTAAVLACKEIIKFGKYKLALELLDFLSRNNGGDDRKSLLNDIATLKLYCQVGLENFMEAIVILDTLPEEISSLVDIKLLGREVYEKMYEKEIQCFREECYTGNLIKIRNIVEENKSVTGFTTLVNAPETLFYIMDGKYSSSKDKIAIMSYLKVEHLLDLNMNNGIALEMAVQKDDISLVQFLMSEGVKMLSYEDGILLFYAAQQNDYDLFFFLKNTGIQIDQELLEEIKVLELTGDMKTFIDHFEISL